MCYKRTERFVVPSVDGATRFANLRQKFSKTQKNWPQNAKYFAWLLLTPLPCIAFEVIFLFLVINVFSPRRPSVVGMATCITSRAQGSWQAVRGACLAFLHGVGRRSTLVFVISSSASDPDRPSSRRRCSCAAVVRRARPLDLS